MKKKTKNTLIGLLAMLVAGIILIKALPLILSLTANLLSLLLILLVVGFLLYGGFGLYKRMVK